MKHESTNLIVYLSALHRSEIGVKNFHALFKDSKVSIFLLVFSVVHCETSNLDMQMLRRPKEERGATDDLSQKSRS